MTTDSKSKAASRRMADYRGRMRASGLRPIQMWLPDTRNPRFVARCRAEASAIAAGNADDGVDIDRWIDAVYEWPEP